jgi:hypothetical protein
MVKRVSFVTYITMFYLKYEHIFKRSHVPEALCFRSDKTPCPPPPPPVPKGFVSITFLKCKSPVMAQTLSRRPLIAEASVRSRGSRSEIYHNGKGSFPCTLVVPYHYRSTNALYTYFIHLPATLHNFSKRQRH